MAGRDLRVWFDLNCFQLVGNKAQKHPAIGSDAAIAWCHNVWTILALRMGPEHPYCDLSANDGRSRKVAMRA